jgi:hypothetical protein
MKAQEIPFDMSRGIIFFRSLVIPIAISLAMGALSVVILHGGGFNPETYDRLPYHLSGDMFVVKIFNNKIMDYGMYQARELSYVADFIDAQFVDLSVILGAPHFLSLIHFLFAGVIACMVWRFVLVDLGLSRVVAALVVLIFWSLPWILLGGFLMRAAKIGVALMVVWVFIESFRRIRTVFDEELKSQRSECKGSGLISYFGLCLLTTLWDRQGVYLIGALGVFLLMMALFTRSRIIIGMLLAVVVAVAANCAYNFLVGPLTMRALCGYSPDFTYQHLPLAGLHGRMMEYLHAGISAYSDSLRFTLGSFPSGLIVFVSCMILLVALLGNRKKISHPNIAFNEYYVLLALGVSTVAMVILMNSLMILRHEGLYMSIFRRVYYFLPGSMLVFMDFLLLLSFAVQKSVLKNWQVIVLCICVLAGNIAAIPSHRAEVVGGWMGKWFPQAWMIRHELAFMNDPSHQVPADVIQDPIFRLFAKRHWIYKITINPMSPTERLIK